MAHHQSTSHGWACGHYLGFLDLSRRTDVASLTSKRQLRSFDDGDDETHHAIIGERQMMMMMAGIVLEQPPRLRGVVC